MKNDALGDRMKRYELCTRNFLVRKTPVLIRVDGKAFHTLTKHAEKPFDLVFISAMSQAASDVAAQMQGCKAVYVQSDEATFLLTDYDRVESGAWFDYNVSKLVSITAASMSVAFNKHYNGGLAVFDARAFNVPREDVANCFLWRAKDWSRNSLQMYARAFFSHKQLHGAGKEAMHEMLHGIGKNWATDISDIERNGRWLLPPDQIRDDVLPSYVDIATLLGGFL